MRNTAERAVVLECRSLRAGYGATTVVPRFDLRASAGEIIAILGPNGAGKTTLLNTLAGLLVSQDGTVAVDGQQLRPGRAAEASRRGLVLVPDDRALFPDLTVEENLKVAAGRRATTTEEMVELFPVLRTRLDVAARNLSGGEQQMLALGRALVQEPRVLLIDEMSMGLAPVVVESLMPIVRHVARDTGAVVVLVEQHVALALDVADRVVVLVHGEVAFAMPAEDLRGDMGLLEAAYFGE